MAFRDCHGLSCESNIGLGRRSHLQNTSASQLDPLEVSALVRVTESTILVSLADAFHIALGMGQQAEDCLVLEVLKNLPILFELAFSSKTRQCSTLRTFGTLRAQVLHNHGPSR